MVGASRSERSHSQGSQHGNQIPECVMSPFKSSVLTGGKKTKTNHEAGRVNGPSNSVHFIPGFIPEWKYDLWLARGGWPDDLWSAGHLTDDLYVDIEDHGGSLSEENDMELHFTLGPEYSFEIGPEYSGNVRQIDFGIHNPFRRSNQFRNWLIFSLLRTMGLSASRIPHLRVEDIDFEKCTLALVPFRYSLSFPFERDGMPERHVPLPTMLAIELEEYLTRNDEHGRVAPPLFDHTGTRYPPAESPQFLFTSASGRHMTYPAIYSLLRLAGERVIGREISGGCLQDSWREEMHYILTMETPRVYCR